MSGKYNGILTGSEIATLELKHKATEAKEAAKQAKLQAEKEVKAAKAKAKEEERKLKQEQLLAEKQAKAEQKAAEKQVKAEEKAIAAAAAAAAKEQARKEKEVERLAAKALADEYSHIPIPDLTVVLADGQSVYHAIKLLDKTTDEREGFWSQAESKILYNGQLTSPHVFLTSHSLDMIKDGKITRSTPHMDIWNTKGHGLYVKLGSVQKPIRLLQPFFIGIVSDEAQRQLVDTQPSFEPLTQPSFQPLVDSQTSFQPLVDSQTSFQPLVDTQATFEPQPSFDPLTFAPLQMTF